MSLKAFHLLFVIVSILFTLLFGVWAVINYSSSEKLDELILGIVSLVGTVIMSIYLFYFLKKLRMKKLINN